MKQTSYKGGSRFQRFLNGNGFYVTIAACLLAIGGAAVALVGQGLSDAPSEESQPPVSQAEPVGQVVTDQPDDRTTTTTTTVPSTTTTTTAAADLYVLPMGNLVQKAYSDGAPAYSVTMQDWRVHDGVDFAGKDGQEVRAMAKGTVKSVTEDTLWGPVVIIDHGVGVESRYCGVHPSVSEGDTVDAGQTLGKLTAIPCEVSQGPHLHLETFVDGKRINPVTALAQDMRYEEGAAPTTTP